LTRVQENSDLATNIVGLWQSESGSEIEFTADGHVIGHEVGEYEVISNNTIIIREGNGEITPLNIINWSNDSLSLRGWGEVYTEGDQPDRWTRVHP